ncbi:MAG: hypothetical protein LC754_15325 [Acidobacteria bacterium]|nr:hypothetical protein [Acidobacteriota bacterium]
MNRPTIMRASLIVLATMICAWPRLSSSAAVLNAYATQRGQAKSSPPAQTSRRAPRPDYSTFSHRTPQHRQACSSCHIAPTPNWTRVREREEAFPDVTDYPDHPSCVNCHRRQFFSEARPVICSVCHSNVSPRDGTRYPFSNPKETFDAARPKAKRGATEFGLNFPHDRHQDVMALQQQDFQDESGGLFVRASFRRQESSRKIDSCSICHRTYQPEGDGGERYVVKPPADLPEGAFWMKKGTFKTTPESHASCFNCHWQDGGEKPLSSDCAGCHKLLPGVRLAPPTPSHTDAVPKLATAMGLTDAHVLEKWQRRDVATFRHEETKHENVGCTACHINISAISLLDARTLNVPLLTCGGGGTGCHIKATIPKKILNIEVEKRRADPAFRCVKCHLNYGREALPQTHLDAVSPPKAK